ncbi:MAG TPA: hypothetical protein VEM40_02015 [Nitrospirota bacterium]|nr:hypothetical protein [Nitrospirota bacterium]
MKLTIKQKQTVILTLLFVLILITLAQGCGSESNSNNCTAPAGSKITISPASSTISTGGVGLFQPTNLNWLVTVDYPDGTVMPKACITVIGTFAVPNGYGLYQFFTGPNSTGVAVNSGFSAQSDDFGQYTFSTLLTAGTGTWTDTLYVQSGTNQGSATITVN